MRDISQLFAALQRSRFRAKFRLTASEQKYFCDRDTALIRQHAETMIRQRLAPAFPAADGKQTPWRGHPVFVAQHATATCCRGCLEKWHHIKRGHDLTAEQIVYIVDIIMHWLELQPKTTPIAPRSSQQMQLSFDDSFDDTHDLLK